MLGELLIIGATVLWGLSNILLKMGIGKGMEPGTANAVQTGTSAIFMILIWLVVLAFGIIPFPAIEFWPLAFLLIGTFVGLGLGTTLYLMGLKHIDASMASPLSSTSPFFVLVMAVIFLNENITALIVAGTVIIFLGVVIIGRNRGEKKVSGKGVLLVSVAPVFWAITVICYKIALGDMDVFTANAIRMTALGLSLCLYVRFRGQGCMATGRKAFLMASGAGLANYVIGGTMFLVGLMMIGASRASPISSGTPFFTMLFASIVLGEKLKRSYIIGGILIVAGVILISV